MPPVRRRLLNLLTALSLLLCAAVVALWVRSYRGGGGFNGYPYLPDRRAYWEQLVVSDGGKLWLRFSRSTVPTNAVARRMEAHVAKGSFQNRWRRHTSYGTTRDFPARRAEHVWERAGLHLRWRSGPATTVDPAVRPPN